MTAISTETSSVGQERGVPSSLPTLALLASGLVWGLTWWPLKFFAGAGLSGHAISLTAYSFVGLAALPWIWRERAGWRREQGLLLLIGLLFGCANVAFTIAMTVGSVVRTMMLFYLLPAWGALGGAFFLKERIGARRALAIFLSLGGVFTILGGAKVLDLSLSLADFMGLAAGFCYAAANVANRKAKAIPMASRTLVAFVGCLVVSVAALPFSQPAFPTLAMVDWLWLALFAAVWLPGAGWLTTYGATHVEASRACVLQVVELLVAVFSAVLLGVESLGPKEWLGGALILAATLLEAGSGGNETQQASHAR